ncbi:aspartic peptidase domain-containing protein, partial [Coprinopsis sp. MPI-PUGE-AT-0042]
SYVLPVTVGREDQPQTFLLQVDSGSSDLWIASTSCNADSCRGSGSRFYNPGGSGALDTGVAFDIDYLRGHVEGPVYWDRVNVGGYSIENQALAAANIVRDEPLSESFHGLIGLALPLNSVISQRLPEVTTNDPDGAAWASNLFSITPVSNAPAARFIGMTLARPGSDRVPSLMAIGRHPVNHPSGVLKEGDVERIQYSTLVSERLGTLFWKTSLRELVVWVNGVPFPIELPRAGTGSVFPTAILDSGVPLIFTTSTIANAIYGAIGVSPSADGQYFVPCETPLNVTVRLDDRASVALHPLDLTADPPDDNRAKFCVGLIQVPDGALGGRESLADVVLGVPFLRNVYSVMAYTQPNPDGTFPDLNTPSPSPPSSPPSSEDEENEDGAGPFDPSTAGPTNQIAPRLGLLGITDPTIAMDEFTTVRVLNKPISNNPPGGGSNADSTAAGRKNQGGLSTGIIVAIVLVSFFGVCAALWVLRWFLHRRRDKMLFFAASAAGAAKKKRDDDVWGDGEGDKEREMVLGSLYGAARTKGSLGGLGTDGYALGAVKSKRSSGGVDVE